MRRAPDYISPIRSYRVWQWEVAGLRSLNGEFWPPNKPLEANCRVCDFALGRSRYGKVNGPHDAPYKTCTCGIYASKSLEHLREYGYDRFRIHGRVSLWGTVVEHQRGWRAQYAYPHRLFLVPEILPVRIPELRSRVVALTRYGCDIIILHDGVSVPLWEKHSGFSVEGLDYLVHRGSQWYPRRNEESAIKAGDRVAIVGRGTAIVEQIDSTHIRAVLGNKSVVRIGRMRVRWNSQNVRWETDHV